MHSIYLYILWVKTEHIMGSILILSKGLCHAYTHNENDGSNADVILGIALYLQTVGKL